MPTTRWLILRGAPSIQEVLSIAAGDTGYHRTVVDSLEYPQLEPWQTVYQSPKPDLQVQGGPHSAEGAVEHSQIGPRSSSEEDQASILAALLEQSRAVAEESQLLSQSRRRTTETSYVTAPFEESRYAQLQLGNSEDSFSESMLPPPTQQRSRMLGDGIKSFGAFGNITEEQSLLKLPSWQFQLTTLTQLNSLPPTSGRSAYNTPRVNLLALIDELELPSTMPVKTRSKGGKEEVTRAGMTLVDETGANLQVVMWDDYAEEWAGRHLLQGDVIYVEKIALSEYKGQRQGSTVSGSKVQICYRTAARHGGRRTDPALRPELDLDWDPISQKVKALAQLATEG